ncbi:MAG: 4Fe-4S binding protein [Chloroflexota bacterium]
MAKAFPTRRQRTRRAVIITSLLLFPIIMNYLSPYVILDGASQGIVNGSLILFGLLFLSSLAVGRLWCAWLCPGGGIGEIATLINDRPGPGGRWNWMKWVIWVPWLGLIAFLAISAGGYRAVNFLHLTETGVSVSEPQQYVIYYIVVGLFFGLALAAGRRAACHTICWMAPFMILGRKLRNLVGWPALRLAAQSEACMHCKRCTAQCPMSLDVHAMVQARAMEDCECILCGSCVDVCPKDVIRYRIGRGV